jgi:hypothetical protein
MRANDELLETFRDAFKPLTCEARVDDYGKQIDVGVLDHVGKVIRQGRYPLTHIRSDLELRTHIENMRRAITANAGIKLLPWILPPRPRT